MNGQKYPASSRMLRYCALYLELYYALDVHGLDSLIFLLISPKIHQNNHHQT